MLPLRFEGTRRSSARSVAGEQKGALGFRSFFVPSSRLGVVARNLITRLAALPGLTKVIAGRTVPPFPLQDRVGSAPGQ